MNQRAQIWIILHDGEIKEIQADSKGNLYLHIDIPWLRNMFPGDGDEIYLTLHQCTQFEMKIWDEGITTSDLKKIASIKTEILETESEDNPIHVVTTLGDLFVNFESFSISLDSQTQISFEELKEACSKYWDVVFDS